MSVYKAARVYNVPEFTLRYETKNNVDLECKPEPDRLFTYKEKMKLADNIVFLANIGYGYSVTDVRCVAANYARFLGKTVNAKGMLSLDRF